MFEKKLMMLMFMEFKLMGEVILSNNDLTIEIKLLYYL